MSKGEIAGKQAFYAMPLAGVEAVPGGAKFERILPPDDCEVHLSLTKNLDHELIHDCATWFLPPEGRYRIWLETPNAISEGYGILIWDHKPFQGTGQAVGFGIEPAGRVALAASVPLADGSGLRLVHLRTIRKEKLRRLFDRRVPGDRVRRGVAMPLGSVFSGIFDKKSNDALALARPVTVQEGKTVFVSPAPPTIGADVFVVLTRPREVELGQDELSLSLLIGNDHRAPDVLIPAADHIVAVWYGLDGGKATLRTTSKTLRLDPVELTLTPGKVTTHRAKLVDR